MPEPASHVTSITPQTGEKYTEALRNTVTAGDDDTAAARTIEEYEQAHPGTKHVGGPVSFPVRQKASEGWIITEPPPMNSLIMLHMVRKRG